MERDWETPGCGDTLPRDIPAAAPVSPKPGTCSQDDAAAHTHEDRNTPRSLFPLSQVCLCHGRCLVGKYLMP